MIAGLLILRSVTDETSGSADSTDTALTTTTATTPISLVGLTPVATTVPAASTRSSV